MRLNGCYQWTKSFVVFPPDTSRYLDDSNRFRGGIPVNNQLTPKPEEPGQMIVEQPTGEDARPLSSKEQLRTENCTNSQRG
jgi:hypothetical protein